MHVPLLDASISKHSALGHETSMELFKALGPLHPIPQQNAGGGAPLGFVNGCTLVGLVSSAELLCPLRHAINLIATGGPLVGTDDRCLSRTVFTRFMGL